jgi:uncharacterized protein DUF4386
MLIVTGILLIAIPLAFNLTFFALQRSFDYPDILRRPTSEVLERFAAGGSRLRATWYIFAFTALLFTPLPVLVHGLFPVAPWYLAAGTALGVVAGFAQVVGLMRWPFLVPLLVSIHRDPAATPARREAAEVTFAAFHRFVGGAIGEHVGYLLTAAWSIIVSIAVLETGIVEFWFGWIGIIAAAGIIFGVLEEVGVKSAAMVNAIAYIVWSLWLIALGVRVLFL